MKTKTFDCVAMKRAGAERLRKTLEGKTTEEQLKYFQQGTEQLRQLQRMVKQS